MRPLFAHLIALFGLFTGAVACGYLLHHAWYELVELPRRGFVRNWFLGLTFLSAALCGFSVIGFLLTFALGR